MDASITATDARFISSVFLAAVEEASDKGLTLSSSFFCKRVLPFVHGRRARFRDTEGGGHRMVAWNNITGSYDHQIKIVQYYQTRKNQSSRSDAGVAR
jgi:hypothetical protein